MVSMASHYIYRRETPLKKITLGGGSLLKAPITGPWSSLLLVLRERRPLKNDVMSMEGRRIFLIELLVEGTTCHKRRESKSCECGCHIHQDMFVEESLFPKAFEKKPQKVVVLHALPVGDWQKQIALPMNGRRFNEHFKHVLHVVRSVQATLEPRQEIGGTGMFM